MSTYGSTGLSMDRESDVFSRLCEKAVEWKGESLSTEEVELLGHIFGQLSYEIDNVNEKVQALYDTMSISNNSGVPLDGILELIGIERQSAAKSTTTETFVASKATTVVAGSIVRTSSKVYWVTDEDLVFTGAGSDTVGITCTQNGPNTAAPGEINTPVTSMPDIVSVTNMEAANPGRNRELDAEAKVRHSQAVATSGERDAASIEEAVGKVHGVSAVKVTEDYTSDTPISVFVIGGDDTAIAEAIDGQRTIGIGTSGSTEVEVYSHTTKQMETIRFTRAEDLDIYASMVLTINPALFPADGDTQIKTAIAAAFEGVNIGDDVTYNKQPTAIYTVPGCTINQLTIGISPSPVGITDVAVSNLYRAVIVQSNIVISHG